MSATRNLINQTVKVSWSGGKPTRFGSSMYLANYLQLMQCWAEPGQQPTREQCQYGGFGIVTGGPVNVASRQLTQFVVDAEEKEYVADPNDPTDTATVPFKSVTGVVEDGSIGSQFFDSLGTNEVPLARTSSDGTGQVFFEMLTGQQAPGLGCGQKIDGRVPDCFLVVVPRGNLEVDGTVRGDIGSGIDSLTSSPLSSFNWRSRIVVPLEFTEIGGACSFGRPETSTVGSDLIAEAMSLWQPELCAGGDRNIGFTSLPDDAARAVLGGGTGDLVFTTKAAQGVQGVVYAPVAVSGLTIAANIERQGIVKRSPTPEEKAAIDAANANAGTRFDQIRLNQRLLAKLLTQSYRYDQTFGTADNITNNPFTLAADPEFLELNPDFVPVGIQMRFPEGPGHLLVQVGLLDSAELVWRYLLADPDAKAFLHGSPDPWGMVVNARYRDLVLPTNTFPRADLGCILPPTVPPGFTQELCTLDAYPYTASLQTSARQVSRGDTDRRDIARLDPSPGYGKSPLQESGSRSMLGLTDTPSAKRYQVVPVALRNSAGEFVAPTDVSLRAGVAAMTRGARGLLAPNLQSKDPAAYPLTVVTYAAGVPADMGDDQRQDYARLIRYAAGEGQQTGLARGGLPEGYLPMTQALREEALAGAAAITAYRSPSPSPTLTPTPSPTPTVDDTPSPTPTPDPTDDPGGYDSGGSGSDGFDSGGSGSGSTDTEGASGSAEPSPSQSQSATTKSAQAVPTASPEATAVASLIPTPDDPDSGTRLTLVVALSLGLVALLARAALPHVVGRPPR